MLAAPDESAAAGLKEFLDVCLRAADSTRALVSPALLNSTLCVVSAGLECRCASRWVGVGGGPTCGLRSLPSASTGGLGGAAAAAPGGAKYSLGGSQQVSRCCSRQH